MARRGNNNRRRQGRSKPPPPAAAEGTVLSLGLQGDGAIMAGGRVVHVPYVLPGEEVRIEASGAKGRLLDVLRPAPARTEPLCRHFGPAGERCGGCILQHMVKRAARDWKQEVIQRTLAAAGLDGVEVRRPLVSPLNSRRRAAFTLVQRDGAVIAGFNQHRSHTVIALSECHILDPALFAARGEIAAIAAPLFTARPRIALTAQATRADNGIDVNLAGEIDDESITLAEREAVTAALGASPVIRLTLNQSPFYERETPRVTFGRQAVPLPPGAFLQATEEGETALQAIIREGIGKAKQVGDLYAGCGTFTFVAAASAAVHAVEGDSAAIGAINRGRAMQPSAGGHPVTSEIRDLVRQPLMPAELARFEAVIIDPPRAGAAEQMAQLARSTVRTVISVSCNPKTFAADAATLVAAGYRMGPVQPVDQFLFSPHVEMAAIFTRAE